MQLLAVPFYINGLGAEAFGLVMFVVSLQAVLAVLDMGMSTTVNREVSRYGTSDRKEGDDWEIRALIRSLELVYLGMSATIVLTFLMVGRWISAWWLKSEHLDPQTLTQAVILSGVMIALRLPGSLYTGVIRGQERQVSLNLITCAFALMKTAASVFIIFQVTANIVVFCAVQLVFVGLETAFLAGYAWRLFGGFLLQPMRIGMRSLRSIKKYAIGIGWITAFAMVIKQVDRIVVSKMETMEMLGYYSTATLVGMTAVRLVQPLQSAIFPRFSGLAAEGDIVTLSSLFHKSAAMSVFAGAPIACLLVFFSPDILWLWTRSPGLVENGWPVLSITGAAVLFNLAMSVPFALQLAVGLTWLPLRMNGIGAALMIPVTVVTVSRYGISGAALGWLMFNIAYYLVLPNVLFRHVLVGERWRWVFRDTLPFMTAGVLSFGLADYATFQNIEASPRYGAAMAGCAAYACVSLAWSSDLRALIGNLGILRGSKRAVSHVP